MGKPTIYKKTPKSKRVHTGVFARLAPSPISGVGVFAIRDIKKSTDVFPDVADDIFWIDAAKVKKLRGEIRRLYENYCILKDGRYGCPVSFNRINVSWYLNHSSKPNVAVDDHYRVYATRKIIKGEELTLDYASFMDIKIPRDWKKYLKL